MRVMEGRVRRVHGREMRRSATDMPAWPPPMTEMLGRRTAVVYCLRWRGRRGVEDRERRWSG